MTDVIPALSVEVVEVLAASVANHLAVSDVQRVCIDTCATMSDAE